MNTTVGSVEDVEALYEALGDYERAGQADAGENATQLGTSGLPGFSGRYGWVIVGDMVNLDDMEAGVGEGRVWVVASVHEGTIHAREWFDRYGKLDMYIPDYS